MSGKGFSLCAIFEAPKSCICNWLSECVCEDLHTLPSLYCQLALSGVQPWSETSCRQWPLLASWNPLRVHWTSRTRQRSGLCNPEQWPCLWGKKPANSEAFCLGIVPCAFSLETCSEVDLCSLCMDTHAPVFGSHLLILYITTLGSWGLSKGLRATALQHLSLENLT